jgi:hypothetical protein
MTRAPMASLARSCKLPPDLAEVAERRARALGYASWNAYIKGLIRFDAMVQGEHSVTLPISHMRPEDQDAIDAALLAATKEGVGQRGQLLSRLIKQVAQEGQEPTGPAIAKAARARKSAR